METQIAEREAYLIKDTLLETLIKESQQNKKAKLITLKDKKTAKKIDKVKYKIRRTIQVIREYAREEMLISRELTLEELLALQSVAKRRATDYLVTLSAFSVLWLFSFLGGVFISSLMFLGLPLIAVLRYLKYGFIGESASENIWVCLMWVAFNPIFLTAGLCDYFARPRALNYLDLDDKTEEYKTLVGDVYYKLLEKERRW